MGWILSALGRMGGSDRPPRLRAGLLLVALVYGLAPASPSARAAESGPQVGRTTQADFAAATVTLSQPKDTSVYGEPATLTATVTSDVNPTGAVEFYDGFDNSSLLASVPLVDGVATLDLGNLFARRYSIQGVFAPTSNHARTFSTHVDHTITPAKVSLDVSADGAFMLSGSTVTVTARTKAAPPSLPDTACRIEFSRDGGLVAVRQPVNGVARITARIDEDLNTFFVEFESNSCQLARDRVTVVGGHQLQEEERVGEQTNYLMRHPAAATTDSGAVIVMQAEVSTGDMAIYAQRIDPAGKRRGSPIRVAVPAPEQADPDLARLPGGGFVVVWTARAPDGSFDVLGRIYDDAGRPAAVAFNLAAAPAGSQLRPSVVETRSGGFFVAWKSSVFGGTPRWSVVARRFAADGTPLSGDVLVNTSTIVDQAGPKVTTLKDGRNVVVWTRYTGSAAHRRIRGQIFSSSGLRIGTEFVVPSGAVETDIAVAPTAKSGFLVAWAETAPKKTVYVQSVAPTGAMVGSRIRPSGTAAYGEPGLARLANGRNVLTMSATLGDSNVVFGQFLDDRQAFTGGVMRVSGYVGGHKRNRPVVVDLPAQDRWLAVWDDFSGWFTPPWAVNYMVLRASE